MSNQPSPSKKENDQESEQTAREDQSQQENAGQGLRPKQRSTDDPSEAPESGIHELDDTAEMPARVPDNSQAD
jgi:hypothetical protein